MPRRSFYVVQSHLSNSAIDIWFITHFPLFEIEFRCTALRCLSRNSHNCLLLSLGSTAASLKSSRNSVSQSLRFNKRHLSQLGRQSVIEMEFEVYLEVWKGLGLGCREWPYFDFNSRSGDIHSNLHLKSDLYYIDPSLQRNDRRPPSPFLPNWFLLDTSRLRRKLYGKLHTPQTSPGEITLIKWVKFSKLLI